MTSYVLRSPPEENASIVEMLQRIAVALETGNAQMAAGEREDIAAASAFVMREACAEEVERLYGPEAAAEIRKVTLPGDSAP